MASRCNPNLAFGGCQKYFQRKMLYKYNIKPIVNIVNHESNVLCYKGPSCNILGFTSSLYSKPGRLVAILTAMKVYRIVCCSDTYKIFGTISTIWIVRKE